MSNEIKKESGPKREFFTGAERQSSEGKGTPVLVPGDAILDVAKHFERGAVVYEARNWEKGIPLSEILNSLERHLQAEKMGMTDESHARALVWNALVYLATKLRIENGLLPAELNDMPMYINLESQNITPRRSNKDIPEVRASVRLTPERIKATVKIPKTDDDVGETIEEVMEINEDMAEEFGKEVTDVTDLNYKWLCTATSCYKRGVKNEENTMNYWCPDHIHLMPKKGN